tara:strand:- start:34 stop:276 length:243 start_codon:yes stop_codon:yes gene_type:complete
MSVNITAVTDPKEIMHFISEQQADRLLQFFNTDKTFAKYGHDFEFFCSEYGFLTSHWKNGSNSSDLTEEAFEEKVCAVFE